MATRLPITQYPPEIGLQIARAERVLGISMTYDAENGQFVSSVRIADTGRDLDAAKASFDKRLGIEGTVDFNRTGEAAGHLVIPASRMNDFIAASERSYNLGSIINSLTDAPESLARETYRKTQELQERTGVEWRFDGNKYSTTMPLDYTQQVAAASRGWASPSGEYVSAGQGGAVFIQDTNPYLEVSRGFDAAKATDLRPVLANTERGKEALGTSALYDRANAIANRDINPQMNETLTRLQNATGIGWTYEQIRDSQGNVTDTVFRPMEAFGDVPLSRKLDTIAGVQNLLETDARGGFYVSSTGGIAISQNALNHRENETGATLLERIESKSAEIKTELTTAPGVAALASRNQTAARLSEQLGVEMQAVTIGEGSDARVYYVSKENVLTDGGDTLRMINTAATLPAHRGFDDFGYDHPFHGRVAISEADLAAGQAAIQTNAQYIRNELAKDEEGKKAQTAYAGSPAQANNQRLASQPASPAPGAAGTETANAGGGEGEEAQVSLRNRNKVMDFFDSLGLGFIGTILGIIATIIDNMTGGLISSFFPDPEPAPAPNRGGETSPGNSSPAPSNTIPTRDVSVVQFIVPQSMETEVRNFVRDNPNGTIGDLGNRYPELMKMMNEEGREKFEAHKNTSFSLANTFDPNWLNNIISDIKNDPRVAIQEGLTASDIARLNPDQLNQLDVTALTRQQMEALTLEQIKVMAPEQQRVLNEERFAAAFTPDEKAALAAAGASLADGSARTNVPPAPEREQGRGPSPT